MKFIIIFLITFNTFSALADRDELFVNCYINDDQGDYLMLSEGFNENKVTLSFEYNQNIYILFVERASTFYNYTYEVVKQSLTDHKTSKFKKKTNEYDQPVLVDDNLSCVTSD